MPLAAAPSYAALAVYEPPPPDDRLGCRETWVLTRAAFTVLVPIMLALFGVFGALAAAVVLFSIHPALALAPVGVLALAVLGFVRWDQGRNRPPDI